MEPTDLSPQHQPEEEAMTIFTQQKERIPEEEHKKREQRIGVKVGVEGTR
jgi:hypothetical protein